MQLKQHFIIHSLFFHPISLATFAFGLGIASYFAPFITAIFVCILIALLHKGTPTKLLLCILTIFILGFAHTCRTAKNHQQALVYLSKEARDITLHITTIELTDRPYLKWLIEGTITDDQHKNINGYSIRIYTSRRPQFNAGSIIQYNAIKTSLKNNESFNRYMIKNHTIGTLFIPQLTYKLIYQPAWSWRHYIHTIKTNLIRAIRKKMNPHTYELFCSIFLGKKSSNTAYAKTIKQLHKQWGTSHYLARSGLHMILFIILWKFLVSLLPISWPLQNGMLSIIALLYALLSWPSISFYRAFGIFLLLQMNIILERRASTLFHIILIALTAMIHNPFHITFLDFQLSFGLAFTLAILQIKFAYLKTQNHTNSCATSL